MRRMYQETGHKKTDTVSNNVKKEDDSLIE